MTDPTTDEPPTDPVDPPTDPVDPPTEPDTKMTHRWAITADIPPAAWAAMSSDIRDILTVTATTLGATVTNPEGTAAPILNANRIAFRVTTPGGGPLTVDMARQAGTSQVETEAMHTTGLVYLTLLRAQRHWGALVTTQSEADTRARAFADALNETLFGASDRALANAVPATPEGAARGIIRAAFQRIADDTPPEPDTVVGWLNRAIEEITAERDGRAAANIEAP